MDIAGLFWVVWVQISSDVSAIAALAHVSKLIYNLSLPYQNSHAARSL